MEAYVFYSHHDYSDIWPLMFGQGDKFLRNKKKYLITNKVGEYHNPDWNFILYDESEPYQSRVYKSLERIEEDVLIFHHEDMFLIEEPRWDLMRNLVNLVEMDEVNIIKLTKASYDNIEHRLRSKNLFYNPNNLLFAIQPSIVKKSNLINIYKHTKGGSIWEFESNSNNLVEFLNYSSCYYHEGIENKRGMFHWDSSIYPYISTAVVKGRWDYESYPKILNKIHSEYKIDPNKRGKNV